MHEKARLEQSKIVIRVHEGGREGNQLKYLTRAKQHMNEHFREIYVLLKFESMNNNDIKENNWSPEQLIDWLLEADIHIILTHVHQGMTCLPGRDDWEINAIQTNLWRLKCHRGFPNALNLKCRIFTQDKWEYLLAVKERTLPTLKVPLTVDLADFLVIEKITK